MARSIGKSATLRAFVLLSAAIIEEVCSFLDRVKPLDDKYQPFNYELVIKSHPHLYSSNELLTGL